MHAQSKLGHEVVALYPSGISIFHKKCHAKKDSSSSGIKIYEMVNPMPVSLLYGIKDSANMMDESSLDETSFEELLKTEKPDVFANST